MKPEIDVKAERLRIADLAQHAIDTGAGRGKVRELAQIAMRLRDCGKHRFALLRGGPVGCAIQGRSLVVGCKVRVCPECAAARRGKFDRRYRPQMQRLMAEGHRVLFLTLTRRPEDQGTGPALTAIRQAWGELRYGRAAKQWWQDRVSGGLYGLEVTLYRRERDGSIACNEYGEPERRTHAHLHAVIVLQIGATPGDRAALEPAARQAYGRAVDRAARQGQTLPEWPALTEDDRQALLVGEDLIQGWLATAKARGWVAERQAQDAQLLAAVDLDNDNRNAAAYLVKYIGKPGDLVTRHDLIDVAIGTKGLRQVQTFGVMHGAALRKTVAAARLAELEATAEALEQDEAEAATFLADLEQSAANDAAAEVDDDEPTAQPHRWAALGQRWRAKVAAAQAWAARATAWAERLHLAAQATRAQGQADRAMAAARAADAAATAQGRADRAAELAGRKGQDPALQAERQGRADRSLARAQQAQARADALLAAAARPLPGADLPGRAAVVSARADRDVERAHWRVIVRDEVTSDVHERATDEQAQAAAIFSGMAYTERDAEMAIQAADLVADRCLQRWQRASEDLAEAHEMGVTFPFAETDLANKTAELDQSRRDATDLRGALRDLRRRLPLTWAVLQRARAECAQAERWAAIVESGDQKRDQAANDRKGAKARPVADSQLALHL